MAHKEVQRHKGGGTGTGTRERQERETEERKETGKEGNQHNNGKPTAEKTGLLLRNFYKLPYWTYIHI